MDTKQIAMVHGLPSLGVCVPLLQHCLFEAGHPHDVVIVAGTVRVIGDECPEPEDCALMVRRAAALIAERYSGTEVTDE